MFETTYEIVTDTSAEGAADYSAEYKLTATIRGSSTTLGVDYEHTSAFSSIPNPTTGLLHLTWSPDASVMDVRIVDAMGVALQHCPIECTQSSCFVDLSTVASGVYHVVFSTRTDVYTQRIVVSH